MFLRKGNEYCGFSTQKVTGYEMQKTTPDELVAYSSISLLTLDRCHDSRLPI